MRLRWRHSLGSTVNRILLVIGVLTLACGAEILATPDASAYKAWCRFDPVVSIDGVVVDIFVAGPPEAPLQTTGPTEVVVTVPRGIDAWLVASDLGFGQGVIVSFGESRALRATDQGIEVKVEVYVPSDDDEMPVLVEFAPRVVGILAPTAVEGTANTWVRLEAVA